jgi:pimeloyl-ACP methyl ester carboxylesterase
MGCCLTLPTPSAPLRTAPSGKRGELEFRNPKFDATTRFFFDLPERKDADGRAAPLVVCIHGIAGGAWQYEDMAAALVPQGFRVLRLDYFGAGSSDLPDGEQNAQFFLDQINGLLEHLAAKPDGDPMQVRADEKFALVGHSLGGAVAVYFAATYPQRLRKLILLAPAGFIDMNRPDLKCFRGVPCCFPCLLGAKAINRGKYIEFMTLGIADKKAHKDVYDRFVREMTSILDRNPGTLITFMRQIVHFPLGNIGPQLEKLKAAGIDRNMMVLWGTLDGTRDAGVPYKDSRQYRSALPNAEFHDLEGAHHTFFVEHKDWVNDHVKRFVSA